jgi:LmbE family N-acetylglucosaminyl deacetylase
MGGKDMELTNGADHRILVVAAHPDDELLGCGGTLALHARAGHSVTAVIGSGGRSTATDTYSALDPQRALKEIGVTDVRLLGLPDQQFETVPLTEIIGQLEAIVGEIRPTIIYTHHYGDINADHGRLFSAVLVVSRPTDPGIKAVYSFDTASSTEWGYPQTFVPDTWVDITETLDSKLAAMASYEAELREYPHPRSLEALRHRAEAHGNRCYLEAAEAFMTVRRVVRGGETPV